MRVLLDECVPKRLKKTLPGHEVRTVVEMGWAGKKNGELLAGRPIPFRAGQQVQRRSGWLTFGHDQP